VRKIAAYLFQLLQSLLLQSGFFEIILRDGDDLLDDLVVDCSLYLTIESARILERSLRCHLSNPKVSTLGEEPLTTAIFDILNAWYRYYAIRGIMDVEGRSSAPVTARLLADERFVRVQRATPSEA
jgi:hypothetical protein